MLAAAAFALLALAACDEGLDIVPEDPRVPGVAAYVQTVATRYAEMGPAGVYDHIHFERQAACGREQFIEALSGEPRPVSLLGIRAIRFDDGKLEAEVKADFVTSEGERRLVWTLGQLANGSWRVVDMPGMSRCTP
jgi:hypothetical protein